MGGPSPYDYPGPDGRTVPGVGNVLPPQPPAPAYPPSPYQTPPQYLHYQQPVPPPGYAPQPQTKQPNVAGGFSVAGLWLSIVSCVFGAIGSTGTQVFYSVWYGAFPIALVALVLSCVGLSLRARRVAATFGLILSILAILGMLGFMQGQYNKTHPSSGSYTVPAAGLSASTR